MVVFEPGDRVRDLMTKDIGMVVEVTGEVGGKPMVYIHFGMYAVEGLTDGFEIVSRRHDLACPPTGELDSIEHWRDGPMDYSKLDREELASAYNRMVGEFRALLPENESYQPVNKFQDTRTGRHRCLLIEASLQRLRSNPQELEMAKSNQTPEAKADEAKAKEAKAPRTPAEPRLNVNSQVARVLKEQGFKRTAGSLTEVQYQKEGQQGSIIARANGHFEVKTPAGDVITGKGHKQLEEVIKTGERPAAVVEAEAAAAAKAKEKAAAEPAQATA